MLKELIKLANELDEKGMTEEADRLDDIIEEAGEEGDPKSTGSSADTVRDAIERTMDMPHFKNTFLMRNPGTESEGSIFNEPQTPETLMAAEWKEFSHPAIMTPAVGYSAPIPGTMNLVKLETLDPQTPIRMELGHKGETEFVTTLINSSDIGQNGVPVDHTVILLGPGEDGHIVWTFHPGDPIRPSTMTPSPETEAAKTVEDAMSLGFQLGKITGV